MFLECVYLAYPNVVVFCQHLTFPVKKCNCLVLSCLVQGIHHLFGLWGLRKPPCMPRYDFKLHLAAWLRNCWSNPPVVHLIIGIIPQLGKFESCAVIYTLLNSASFPPARKWTGTGLITACPLFCLLLPPPKLCIWGWSPTKNVSNPFPPQPPDCELLVKVLRFFCVHWDSRL